MSGPSELQNPSSSPPGSIEAPPNLVARCYDVLGHRAIVAAAPGHPDEAVSGVLGAWLVADADPVADEPRYELIEGNTGWLVRLDEAVLTTTVDFQSALASLEYQLFVAALEKRDDLVHLHGAALCAPTRRAALVVAGDSGTGKTTLTLALMLRGLVPFGDDVTLIAPATLEVRAVRRAFHVDDRSWQLLEQLAGWPVRREDGAQGYFSPPQWASRDAVIEWILFPEFRPGQPPQLVPVSPAEAAAKILGNCLSIKRASRLALGTTARLVERVPCYRFLVGDLGASVATVLQMVGAGAPASDGR